MSNPFRPPTTFNFPSPNTPARKAAGKSSFLSHAPSTTPKEDPPSYLTYKSTTPQGQPRSSKIFGSSFNAAANTFGHRNTPGRKVRGGFVVPESSPPYDDEEDAEGAMEEDGFYDGRQDAFMSSMLEPSPQRGLKRSRDGIARDSGMREIARALAREAGPATQLDGVDDVVLGTERIMAGLDGAVQEQMAPDRDETITSSSAQLTKLWSQYAHTKTKSGGVGPAAEDPLSKATYLSTLLLQLHNPHTTKSPAKTTSTSRALVLPWQSQSSSIPLPRALLDWLNTHHTPLPDDFSDVHLRRPSPSAHESFWDLVGSDLLRGRFARVIRLLKDAGFEHAITAQDDGSGRRGYEGKQLENVEEVIGRFGKLLETSPAVRDENWDIKGAEWSLFRQRVRQSISDLESFSNTGRQAVDQEPTPPESQNKNIFAPQSSLGASRSMAAASIRAGSRVPWTIYENLRNLHGILLGGEQILDHVQDWVEGAILLTAWWDGDDGGITSASLFAQSSMLRQSKTGRTREVDVAPLTAYRRRLGEMFKIVTETVEEAVFQPDTLDAVQVGLACVMEDAVESVVGLVRGLDLGVAAAVVEFAALGGWLPMQSSSRPVSKGRGLLQQGFSSEDLMVLSHGPGAQQPGLSSGAVDRDEILTEYAELLAAKDVFKSSDGKTEREGWELAVSVLGRLDDAAVAQERIKVMLENIQFHDEARVDKVLALCAGMGLEAQARGIAERYADTLSSPSSYGVLLIYYARAHATRKLKATLSLLISLCLLQSTALPGPGNLDARLGSLLSTERAALVSLAEVDMEAASLLSGQLSGYATLRRFYELRDQDATSTNVGAKVLRSLERKREAAKALMAVIESASDCIRGGLFDPEVESVVPVDGLLALLGEALPFLGQEKRIFTKSQVFGLLRIIEDIDTAPGKIKQGAAGLLQASMNAYRGTGNSGLKKSRSNLSTASISGSGSSWDMLAESALMVRSMESAASGASGASEGKTVDLKRTWDWRKGMDAVAGADVECKDVLGLLRIALAREVARGWSGSIGW